MICNRVIFDGQTILTVYHKNFDECIGDRRIRRETKVGSYDLVFEEERVEDEVIKGWTPSYSGLLEPDSKLNPYGSSACSYTEHYVNFKKPEKLFKFVEDRYKLKIGVEDFQTINQFVKEYTGISTEKYPMIYGDVLVCGSYSLEHHQMNDGKSREGVTIKRPPKNSEIIVNFKEDEMIVSTKKVRVSSNLDEIDIKSDAQWTSHDIQIFSDGELIYFSNNISYMNKMTLQLNIMGTGKRVKLNKIGKDIILNNDIGEVITKIGDNFNNYEEVLSNSNLSIIRHIKSDLSESKDILIKPGELEKAKGIIVKVLESAENSVAVFDSYFTDKNDVKGMIDWIRIIASCESENKEIIFCCKDTEKALDLKNLEDEISNDHVLSQILRTRGSLGIRFYQTEVPIHDRFIFTETRSEYSGISIGTSFNSLGDNHYCIHILGNRSTNNIYNDLKYWLTQNKKITKEKMI